MDKRWSIKLCQLLLSQACNKRRKIFYPYFNLYIFSNNGFFENSQINNGSILKNFEVENQDYELSLNQSDDNKISVAINSSSRNLNPSSDTIEIIPISKNKFKATLPNGEEKFYVIDSDKVIELSTSNAVSYTHLTLPTILLV